MPPFSSPKGAKKTGRARLRAAPVSSFLCGLGRLGRFPRFCAVCAALSSRKRTAVIVAERHLENDDTPAGGEVVGNRIFFCSTLRGADERLEKDPTFACIRHVI